MDNFTDMQHIIDCQQFATNAESSKDGGGLNWMYPEPRNYRSDKIVILDELKEENAVPPPLQSLIESFERLAEDLSQVVKLSGPDDVEQQLAYYPPNGAGYDMHTDSVINLEDEDFDDVRRLTAILYLNTDWKTEHGGSLRVFPPHEDPEQQMAGGFEVAPVANRLVCFLSSAISHQVCASFSPRLAITTWYF
jgi:Rps23 Pro-64 3,4-dihydroxylase Tpa1-like proline 4-hydroxylase